MLILHENISCETYIVTPHLNRLIETVLMRGHNIWATYFRSPSAFLRRAVVSYWRKYVHKVLVNRLGGLSLPRKSVVRLTDRPDMTLDVYRGRKTTIQQQQYNNSMRNKKNAYLPSFRKVEE